jgi:glutamyl-Q tRNA(Asp) synthetase
LGSLVAAVASYLDARHHGGVWLVRMEDLDAQRTVPGSAAEILATLETFGLTWDGEVLYQSRRAAVYEEALARLTAAGLTLECSCSRRELSAHTPGPVYRGTCRAAGARSARLPTSTRFRVDLDARICFADALQGPQDMALSALRDVVIRRRDGVFAYQLAVVTDDAAQGVTDVVRGADLLESTAWQIALQRALELPTPRYAHVPVVLDASGEKLAKSRRSLALAACGLPAQLTTALCLLGLRPPPELAGAPPAALLEWAVPRWPDAGLRGVRSIPAHE